MQGARINLAIIGWCLDGRELDKNLEWTVVPKVAIFIQRLVTLCQQQLNKIERNDGKSRNSHNH